MDPSSHPQLAVPRIADLGQPDCHPRATLAHILTGGHATHSMCARDPSRPPCRVHPHPARLSSRSPARRAPCRPQGDRLLAPPNPGPQCPEVEEEEEDEVVEVEPPPEERGIGAKAKRGCRGGKAAKQQKAEMEQQREQAARMRAATAAAAAQQQLLHNHQRMLDCHRWLGQMRQQQCLQQHWSCWAAAHPAAAGHALLAHGRAQLSSQQQQWRRERETAEWAARMRHFQHLHVERSKEAARAQRERQATSELNNQTYLVGNVAHETKQVAQQVQRLLETNGDRKKQIPKHVEQILKQNSHETKQITKQIKEVLENDGDRELEHVSARLLGGVQGLAARAAHVQDGSDAVRAHMKERADSGRGAYPSSAFGGRDRVQMP